MNLSELGMIFYSKQGTRNKVQGTRDKAQRKAGDSFKICCQVLFLVPCLLYLIPCLLYLVSCFFCLHSLIGIENGNSFGGRHILPLQAMNLTIPVTTVAPVS